MKTTLRLARVELSSLFYSPIAWFLLILFMIQISMAYLSKLDFYVTGQETGRFIYNLTFETFADRQRGGLFVSTVLNNLYLYIPLITMGLISRETYSGTIKLLYSSPVKLSEIILGKYFAMLVFNLCLILVLVIVVIFASFHITSIDLGMIISGLFGIYLLLSAYAAIGIFMSCLSSYQVVAAIATFALFALLNFVGTLWQEYDFFRDLAHYLSISGRTEKMIYGLITTREVIYYLLITAMFLAFALFRLQRDRKSISWYKSFAKYSLAIVISLIIGVFSSKPGNILYWDLTQTQMNTLSTNVQQILKEIGDEPLEVTYYANLLDNSYTSAMPRSRISNNEYWERYLRFKPNIKLNYVYYYDSVRRESFYKNVNLTLDEMAEKRAKAYKTSLAHFKKPEEIQKIIDLYPENNRLVMQLKFKGKTTFLRTFQDLQFWPSETETAAALMRLTMPLPRIGFLQGEEERSIEKTGDRHYKLAANDITIRQSLINQGFDVESLTLKGEQIPAGLNALVIADPRAAFDSSVLKKINQYIDAGGNLLLAGEPGKQSILNPILSHLGVQLMDGILVQDDSNYSPDEVKSYVTVLGTEFGRKVTRQYHTKDKIHTRGVAGLTYTTEGDFTIRPLLKTDPALSWNKTGKVVLDSADLIYNPLAGDEKKAYTTAVALTRNINNKEQRILVTGDADLLSNIELSKAFLQSQNANFFQGFLGWFSYGKFPIDLTWPDPVDNSMKIKGEKVIIMKWLLLGVIPGFLLLMGSILLIRRKRK